MPKAAPRPCTRPGCGLLIAPGAVCPKHPTRDGSFSDRSRGTRHERGYGAEWDVTRAAIMKRDAGLCQPCLQATPERVTRAYAVDHIVNKAEGGTDDESNLRAICRACHKAKTQEESKRGRGGKSSGRFASGPSL
jgi:5-methylcytosine-specific restriction protein A